MPDLDISVTEANELREGNIQQEQKKAPKSVSKLAIVSKKSAKKPKLKIKNLAKF